MRGKEGIMSDSHISSLGNEWTAMPPEGKFFILSV